MQPLIIEKSGWNRLRHERKGFEQTLVVGIIDKTAQGGRK